MMKEVAKQKDKRMTTDEVCRALGCDKSTLMRNWREIETVAGATTVKQIERGKPACWTESEVTLLLEKIKGNANNQHGLQTALGGVETGQSRVLRLQILQKQMQDIYEAEISDLRAANSALQVNLQATQALLDRRTDGLSMIQRIAEAGGLVMSDRDDMRATYGR